MEIKTKAFEELGVAELYSILQLRSEVFVVEQDCVYQDLDGKDQQALHVMGFKNHKLVAYSRCFNKGDYFEQASIGRVLVEVNNRKYGYGHQILSVSINEIVTTFKTTEIKISAQKYLTNFYESHGFKQVGEGYLEDGIPHIAMLLNPKSV